jgi:hypothetical protein
MMLATSRSLAVWLYEKTRHPPAIIRDSNFSMFVENFRLSIKRHVTNTYQTVIFTGCHLML